MPAFIFHISLAFLKEFISALIFINLHIDNEPQIPYNKKSFDYVFYRSDL